MRIFFSTTHKQDRFISLLSDSLLLYCDVQSTAKYYLRWSKPFLFYPQLNTAVGSVAIPMLLLNIYPEKKKIFNF